MGYVDSDLLRTAGYSKGDFFILPGGTKASAGSVMLSSADTWTGDSAFHDERFVWDATYPGEVQGAVAVWLSVGSVGSETVDVRLQNITDGETVDSTTGITSNGTYQVGPTAYTPPTTASATIYRAQIRSTGTGAVLNGVTPGWGIQL